MATEKNSLELYFEWWLEDMKGAGYIKSYKREPESLQVSPTVEYGRLKRFKSKENVVEMFNLFPEINYTYDHIITWEKIAEYLFYEEATNSRVFQFGRPQFVAHIRDGDTISYVDVKPTNSVQQRGGKVSSAISFPLKQRLLWENHGIFINKVVPMPMAGAGYSSALFVKTFTPRRYMLTDGGGQARKIKWPIVNLRGYVETKTKEMNQLLNATK